MDRLPKGTCEYSRRDGRLHIDRADSRILISLELLDMFVRGELRPEVSVRVRDPKDSSPGCWLGAVIRLPGANRTVIYRLTERVDDPAGRCLGYIAEWPD